VYGRLAALLKGKAKTERLIRWSRVVTCGNPNIAADVRSRGTEAILLPPAVDLRLFHPREMTSEARGDILRIGWIGTHTTYPFLERLRPVFDRLAREHHFALEIIGSGRPDVDTRPWSMNTEAEDIRSFDIGVYPLTNDEWNTRKSGLKAVQYMASGIPFVMSPVGVGATIGVRDRTHFLATTDDEWLEALRRLLADAGLRRRMGEAGRAFAEEHCSLERAADLLAAVFLRAVS
jgi:glycosyltransferase involved in cell wall biosynthesis